MNPGGLFGSSQAGAFQAPSSTTKSSLFQAFGQPGSSGQPQAGGFGQPGSSRQPQAGGFGQPGSSRQPQAGGFGQPGSSGQPQAGGFGQPSVFGQTQTSVFGQTPAFGQTPSQSSVFGPPAGQSSAFPALAFGQATPGFGTTPLAFGQTQGSVFGQTPAVGQPSGFSQPTTGFALATTTSQTSSGSSSTPGPSQPMSFGQPLTTPTSSSSLGAAQNVTQNRGFGQTVFKPIFSAGLETSSQSSSTVGTTSSFSILTGAKGGPLGFSFSQPAAAASISTQKEPLSSTCSNTVPASGLQFTFSQPAAPSSSTSQPTTPSSFSFSAKALQPQVGSLFGGACFPQAKAEPGPEEPKGEQDNLADTNVFARLGKGTKRKEEAAERSSSPEKPVKDGVVRPDAPRQPPKRALLRSHPPLGGLFGRAVSGLLKGSSGPLKREAVKENQQQAADWGGDSQRAASPTEDVPQAASPPPAPTPTREGLQEAEESLGSPGPEAKSPGRRTRRRESSDSLGGLAPSDLTVLQCKNIPPQLNRKDLIEQHFGQYGKICKVLCRPNKNLAIVYFQDHGSAAKAKKRGKMMKHQELLLLWQRKKHSPGDGAGRSAMEEEQQEGEHFAPKASSSSSPLSRPPPRTPTVSSSTLSRSSPVKKPSIVKSLQFDADPQQMPSQESQSSDRLVPSSLLPLIGQLAESAEEKYRLLEQRDKILRQGRPKRTDLVLSKVFVGTCPDMCPEKERYMRETRNQLSSYELIPNTEMVDHTAAIKEYSRSSADQEEPLPHELRPLLVLSRTMDYLVTQVMDLGQDNLRDWYDFVWNRTRGIRKDITQQHLCCPSTVALIEKCVRFHVHCAHHLCEEPMMTFDAKINNENMTKCLQSLKEMYQDLEKRHIHCPHEAEFRQYHVLLNLNEGDILREVQQLRDDVRNSPEVKFAVHAFTALNSNNYVRFFKLLKGASYLASCLLHRYFNQVRAKALRTLTIAHTVNSQRSTSFPVDDVVRMLMFPSPADASHFLLQYGLSVSDSMVELSRPSYQDPELSVPQRRSEVIMGKKTMLIGEVVNGGPLPSPPVHTPVCSFDSHHRYRGEGPPAEPSASSLRDAPTAVPVFTPKPQINVPSEAEPQLQATPPQESQASPESSEVIVTDETGEPQVPVAKVPSPPPAEPQPVYSDEDLVAEVEDVLREVVEAEVSEVASAAASYTTTALQESSGQMESLVSEVIDHMLREMSASEVQLEQERVAEEKRTQEEARRRREHEAFLAQVSVGLCAEVVQEVLEQSIQETASAEIQAALKEKAELEAHCTEQVCTALVEDTLDTDITLLVESILEAELQRIHKCIKRWRDVVAVRRQLKRQMRGFPAAPCCVDPHFKLRALAPSAPPSPSLAALACGLVDLGNGGTLAFSSSRLLKMRQAVVHKMRVHYFYQRLLDESVWTPLDLPALVTENIPNAPDRIFWKAVLLLPSDHESVAALGDRVLSDWLEVKFGGREGSEVKEKPTDGNLQSLCVTNELQERGQRTHKVHISIKVSRGPLSEDSLSRVEEGCELQGTGALLMLLPAPLSCPRGPEDEEVPLLSALLQLRQLQQASAWHHPVPLAILVPGLQGGTNTSHNLEEALMLKALVEDGLISEFIFLHIPETTSDLQGSEQLSHAVRWLLGHAPTAPSTLSVQTLVQLVESCLSREFTSRLYAHRQDRAAAGLPSQDPLAVIQLYNGVLGHLAEAVSSSQLSSLSWPPGEFAQPTTCPLVPPLGWNAPEHLAWLRTAVLSLQLPPWEPPASCTSWTELCSSISSYIREIPTSSLSRPLLMSRLDNLLERLRRRRTAAPGPSSLHVPWDDLVLLCVDHKLKDWHSPTPPVCHDVLTEDGQILVFFSTETLKGFQPPQEWNQNQPTAQASSSAGASSSSLRQRLFQSPQRASEPKAGQPDITQTPSAQELLPLKLLQGLEEEKILSQRSTQQLQRWLDADPLDSVSTPLFLPSSTLLSMPPTVVPTRPARPRQQPEAEEPAEKAFWPKGTRVSMTQRLKDIERQIAASQEEELACRLTLSSLLGVVDD